MGAVNLPAHDRSGKYTPTFRNVLNVASITPGDFWYAIVGDVVFVAGSFELDPTGTGPTVLGISLPFAKDITDAGQLTGIGVHGSLGSERVLAVLGTTSNNDANVQGQSSSTSPSQARVSFSYKLDG